MASGKPSFSTIGTRIRSNFVINEDPQKSPLPGTDTLEIEIIKHRQNLPEADLENFLNGSGSHEQLDPTFVTSAGP